MPTRLFRMRKGRDVMSISTCAKTLGICVNRKVGGLQSAYLAGSSSARASLARLRKTDQQGGAPWIVVGEELFEDLPDLGYGPAVEHKELLSIRASLRYYAMLQQSKKYPVALIGSKGNEGTFGSACGRIASGDDKGAPGVRRRMAVLESATDFNSLENGIRALIQLMHAADSQIQLDFGRLAGDLLKLQFEDMRQEVFEAWARDYYRVGSSTSTKNDKEE
jgi:CRISPR system Cascade subunit CasB